MSLESFREKLERKSGVSLELVVTRNRSTMLNLLQAPVGIVRLSIHEIFLQAPDQVLKSVAHYIKRSPFRRKHHSGVLQRYIDEQMQRSSYLPKKKKPLRAAGKVYHLQELFQQVNRSYFESSLELPISWFTPRKGLPTSRVVFGKYEADCEVIKINERLDAPFVPRYFLLFVLYHEALHHLIPSYVDERGRVRKHGPYFKHAERRFKDYERAKKWQKSHLDRFLAISNG